LRQGGRRAAQGDRHRGRKHAAIHEEPDAPTAVSAEDRQRLAALGYIGTPMSQPVGRVGKTRPDPKDNAPVLKAYRQAVDALSEGQVDDAATILRRVLTMDLGMTDVWVQYATVLMRMGQSAGALAAYEQAIRLNPEEPGGLLGAASLLLERGRPDDAQRHAELAVAGAPASAHEMLAQIALSRKDWDRATREADLTERADPTMPMTLVVRGLFAYHQGRYAEALPSLVQARDRFAARTLQMRDLRYYIGDALARLERYPEAEPYFLEECALFPTNTRARASLAMLYIAEDRPTDVNRVIADMLRAAPTPKTYNTAAQLWRNFRQPDRADAVSAAGHARFGKGPGR
jgi:tetratricopeptide (TPR) repeat protein